MRQGFQAVLEAVHSGSIGDLKEHAKRFSKTELMELKDAFGRTILHHASQQGHTSLCSHMVDELKLDINAQDLTGGWQAACSAQPRGEELVHLPAPCNG